MSNAGLPAVSIVIIIIAYIVKQLKAMLKIYGASDNRRQ